MTTRRTSIEVDILGRITAKFSRAFDEADERINMLTASVSGLNEKLQMIDAPSLPFDEANTDVNVLDGAIDRVDSSIGGMNNSIRDSIDFTGLLNSGWSKMLIGVGAVGGAVGLVVTQLNRAADRLRDLNQFETQSIDIGIDNVQLQRLEQLSEFSGIDLTGIVGDISSAVQEASLDQSSAAGEAFSFFGLPSAEVFREQLRDDPLAALDEVGQRIQFRFAQDERLARHFASQFGVNIGEIIGAYEQLETLESLPIRDVIGPEERSQLTRTAARWKELGDIWGNESDRLKNALLPAYEGVTSALITGSDWVLNMLSNSEVLQSVLAGIAATTLTSLIAKTIIWATTAIPAAIAGIGGMIAGLTTMNVLMGGIPIIIGLIVTGIVLLSKHFGGFSGLLEFLGDLWDDIWSNAQVIFRHFVNGIVDYFFLIPDTFRDVLGRLIDLANKVPGVNIDTNFLEEYDRFRGSLRLETGELSGFSADFSGQRYRPTETEEATQEVPATPQAPPPVQSIVSLPQRQSEDDALRTLRLRERQTTTNEQNNSFYIYGATNPEQTGDIVLEKLNRDMRLRGSR